MEKPLTVPHVYSHKAFRHTRMENCAWYKTLQSCLHWWLSKLLKYAIICILHFTAIGHEWHGKEIKWRKNSRLFNYEVLAQLHIMKNTTTLFVADVRHKLCIHVHTYERVGVGNCHSTSSDILQHTYWRPATVLYMVSDGMHDQRKRLVLELSERRKCTAMRWAWNYRVSHLVSSIKYNCRPYWLPTVNGASQPAILQLL